MVQVTSLMDLAAGKVITDHSSLRNSIGYLPRTILESLIVASIKQMRILALRVLLYEWPLRNLILQDCDGFQEIHAVLIAFILQKRKKDLETIDLRGCRTGILGTTAFCKLALGLPVSQNDVSDMSVVDCRPLLQEQSAEYVGEQEVRVPPLTVILDCFVNTENFELVRQALVKHSLLDVKVCSLVMIELGRRKVCSLASFLESDIITVLDVSMNSLESQGIINLSKHLKNFRNLTELNLSYNRLKHGDTSAIVELASAISQFSHLKRLNLMENHLGSEGCMLMRSISTPLQSLVLSGCGFRSDELNVMCNFKLLHHLEHFELSTSALVNCLSATSKFVCKSSATLKHLSLEDNMFVSSSVNDLCQMAKKLKKLETFSICYNHLVPEDIRRIQSALPHVKVINRDWLF